MTINYKIRQIKAEDNSRIARIIRDNLKNYGLDIPGTAYFDDSLDNLYEYYYPFDNKCYYVMVDDNDRVIGGVGFDKDCHFENCAELQKLYLADNVKGLGLSYILMEYIEKQIKQKGYSAIYLETHDNLKTAIHVYNKCGYVQIEQPGDLIHSAMNMFFYKQLDK